MVRSYDRTIEQNRKIVSYDGAKLEKKEERSRRSRRSGKYEKEEKVQNKDEGWGSSI